MIKRQKLGLYVHHAKKTKIKILIDGRVEKLDEFEYLDKFLIGLLTGIVKDVRSRIAVGRK